MDRSSQFFFCIFTQGFSESFKVINDPLVPTQRVGIPELSHIYCFWLNLIYKSLAVPDKPLQGYFTASANQFLVPAQGNTELRHAKHTHLGRQGRSDTNRPPHGDGYFVFINDSPVLPICPNVTRVQSILSGIGDYHTLQVFYLLDRRLAFHYRVTVIDHHR